jgi:hypothetical protein
MHLRSEFRFSEGSVPLGVTVRSSDLLPHQYPGRGLRCGFTDIVYGFFPWKIMIFTQLTGILRHDATDARWQLQVRKPTFHDMSCLCMTIDHQSIALYVVLCSRLTLAIRSEHCRRNFLSSPDSLDTERLFRIPTF